MNQLINIMIILISLMVITNHLSAESLVSDDEADTKSSEIDEIDEIDDLSIDKEFTFPRDI